MITRSNTLSELEKLKTELEETKGELEKTKNELKIFKTQDYKLRIELKNLYTKLAKDGVLERDTNRLSSRLKECRLELTHKKKELYELKQKIECKFHEHINDIIKDIHSYPLYKGKLNRLYSDWCKYLDVDINCTVNNEKCGIWGLYNGAMKDKDFSVLMKAAYKNEFELCEFLIDKGAVVDSDEYMESCGINKESRDKLFKLYRIYKLATDLYDKLPADKRNLYRHKNSYLQKFKDLLSGPQGELHLIAASSQPSAWLSTCGFL